MNKLLAIAFAAVLVSSCGAENQTTSQAAAEPVPVGKLPPQKYYSMKDGHEYGYEQAVSQDAANKGQVAVKLLMFKFAGERNGVLQFYAKEADVVSVFQCERPCEYVKQLVFYNGRLLRKDHIRAVEGSIAWAVVQDAQNGYLTKFTREREGKLQEVWFDESGPIWKPVSTPGM